MLVVGYENQTGTYGIQTERVGMQEFLSQLLSDSGEKPEADVRRFRTTERPQVCFVVDPSSHLSNRFLGDLIKFMEFKDVGSESPFNLNFCSKVEYALSAALKQSPDPVVSEFWCDGVLVPSPEQLEKKRVNDKRQIVTSAWLGEDGQINFEMIIHLGKYALRRYAKGTDLTDTIPSSETSDWIELDLARRKVVLYLL